VIDAHHHLWKLSRADYGWIGDARNPALAPIERDYLVEDYRSLAAENGISGSIVVQAAQTVAETRWLLDQARASNGLIKGVVGWIDMAAGDAPDLLRDLANEPLLRSIRPMLQEIADVEWILQPKIVPALHAVKELDLSFDLLVRPAYLKAALTFLTRNPDLVAIFAANDGMALGAVEAARAAGKDKIVIVGVDGNSDAVKSIKDGRLNASVAQLPYLVGKQAVENVKKALAGSEVQGDIAVPTLVLTKEVLDAGKEPMLQYVK